MNIGIIGAGVTGLTAAYDLSRAGHRVTVYEARPYAGGLAAGFSDERWAWPLERFYHHWFATDRHVLGLIDELGASEHVFFPRPTTTLYYQGRLYPLDSPVPALRFIPISALHRALRVLSFSPIPLVDRLRAGLVGFYLTLTRNWQPLERVTADEWLRRYIGERAYDVLWKPLLISKFGEEYYRQVNMAWMWARLKARTTRLGTFEGGFQRFADLFSQHLRTLGVEIRLQTPVMRIEPQAETGSLRVRSEVEEEYDRVLVTLSPQALTQLVPSLPEQYGSGLRRLKSMGAVVMVLSLRQRLSREGYYWYNLPKAAGFPFLALVEHTNFVSPRHFGGDHIVYLGDYLEPEHEYFRLSQDELLERFLPSLTKINPAFERSWIRKVWLFRTAYAQPVPLVNHSANIPPIATPVPGLYLASMSQVYPWDRGTNFAVEIGRRAARQIMTQAPPIR